MSRFLAFSFLIIILFTACKKNKPPTGTYEGNFWGTYKDTSGNIISKNRFIKYLYILNTSKTSITMTNCSNCYKFSLSKGKKNKISGVMNITNSSASYPLYVDRPITINGKWEKSNDKYYIKGDFSYNYEIIDSLSNQTYIVTGNFEIKSID